MKIADFMSILPYLTLNIDENKFSFVCFQRSIVWVIRKMSLGCLSLDQEIGASDTVLLDPLNEDSFIANLHQRFKRDQIYVSKYLFFPSKHYYCCVEGHLFKFYFHKDSGLKCYWCWYLVLENKSWYRIVCDWSNSFSSHWNTHT